MVLKSGNIRPAQAAQTLAATIEGSSPDTAAELQLHTQIQTSASWQRQMAEALRSPQELAAYLGLSREHISGAADQLFQTLVTRSFADRMEVGNPADPLLRQVLPLIEETVEQTELTRDPLDEANCSIAPGLLQKYQGRALMISTGVCAIHCRYCFRRHFPYQETSRRGKWWEAAFAAIKKDENIEELILSGGDPLMLPNSQLRDIILSACAMPQVKRIRFHTRLPIVLPDRIDEEFLQIIHDISVHGRQAVMVVHCNHAQELNAAVQEKLQAIKQENCDLLNQSVLLRAVNDNASVLLNLSRRLHECGVLPYYLHQMDKVRGAGHFMVSDERVHELLREVHANISGYLVPRLVREIPGESGKTLL